MSDLNELFLTLRAESIAYKLFPNAESDWRYFCRKYSTLFHTPLKEVLQMEPEHVILNVFEAEMDNVRMDEQIEEVMERIYAIEDPEYDAKKAKTLEDQDRLDEEEEAERQRLNKPLHKSLASKSPFNQPPPPKEKAPEELPKEGFIDLSYLSKEEES